MTDTTLPDPLVPKKRPAFQFYPADWRKDVELRSCSLAARGLWIDLMCVAHECDPYGHLVLNGRPMNPAQIAGQIGNVTAAQVKRLLDELLDNGVARRSDEGAIFSKRMVEDERLREMRAEVGRTNGQKGAEFGKRGAEYGALGGRPRRAETGADNPGSEPGGKPPKNPHPSSSSSSSSSTSTSVGRARGTRLAPDWDPGETGFAFAASEGLANGRASAELAKFRDYWAAQPGQSGVKTDWQATWRNWVRKAKEYAPKGDPKGDDVFAGSR